VARLQPFIIVLQVYDFFKEIRHDFLEKVLILSRQDHIFSIVEDATKLRGRKLLSAILNELC
jgi:hypothetical protein